MDIPYRFSHNALIMSHFTKMMVKPVSSETELPHNKPHLNNNQSIRGPRKESLMKFNLISLRCILKHDHIVFACSYIAATM